MAPVLDFAVKHLPQAMEFAKTAGALLGAGEEEEGGAIDEEPIGGRTIAARGGNGYTVMGGNDASRRTRFN